MTKNVPKLIKQAREIGKKNPLAMTVIEALIEQVEELQDLMSVERDSAYSDGLADGQRDYDCHDDEQ